MSYKEYNNNNNNNNRVRYTCISGYNAILVQLFTIVDRYISTDTMIDNRTGSCKASYTYAVIHKYNRTDVEAKPGMHIQLFTDTIELVYMQNWLFTDTIELVYMQNQLFTDTIELVYMQNQVHIYSYSQIQVYMQNQLFTDTIELVHLYSYLKIQWNWYMQSQVHIFIYLEI